MLLSDSFWKDKFLYDFPEMIPYGILKWGAKYTWKKCYLVTRYFICKCRRAFINKNDRKQFLHFNKIYSYPEDPDLVDVTIHKSNGGQIGSSKQIRFKDYLRDIKCKDYLLKIPDSSYILRNGTNAVFPFDGNNNMTFGMILSRGYAKKSKKNVITIG